MALVTVDGRGQQGIALGDAETQLLVPMEAIISMFAISNVWLIGPTFDMLILDSGGSTLNPLPADGMKLKITMGDTVNSPYEMNFRCVGSPVVEATSRGPAIRVSATLDAPKLYHSVCRTTVSDTSSNAIKQLALECGLIVDTTDEYAETRVDNSVGDSMKWRPMGRKYGFVLADIAAHGWFGEESAASVVGVTLAGQVVYRDLAKLAKKKPKHAFYYGLPSPNGDFDYVVHSEAREDLHTTSMGQQGYNASRTTFNLDGTLSKLADIGVTLQNEHVNIGSDIKAAVGLSRVVLGALDCGNTHKYYDRAEHQNTRYRSTFSRQISVATAKATRGLDLLDPVTLHYINQKTKEPASTSGLVTAKTLAIVNGWYVERYNIGYQGEDADVIS